MRFFSKKSAYIVLLALSGMLAGCRHDELSYDEDISGDGREMPRVTLNVMPIALGKTSDNVVEMIGSLRVIMLNEVTTQNEDGTTSTESYVEYNEYFNFKGEISEGGMFSGPGEVASTFRFILTRNSVPGKKKFYLIANENMVSDVKFQLPTGETLPDGIEEGMSLHDFLENYGADFIENLEYPLGSEIPEEGEPKGAEFEKLVNCLYYTPVFTQEQQTMGDGSKRNVIFLPYSSYYTYSLATQSSIDSGEAEGAVNILDGKMYLVPAATKFRFQLQNYRRNKVVVSSFKIAGMAKDIFLFAQVGNKDLNKTYGDRKNLWWVDWLALVSDASTGYSDPDENLGFSTTYGWINDYEIPAGAIDQSQSDVMDNATRDGVVEFVEDPKAAPWEVPANTSEKPVQGPPGILTTGYYYLPESRYMVDFPIYDDNGEAAGSESLQAYYLKIAMTSGEFQELKAVKDTQIGNLGSMFRNTNTYITIKLRDALDVGAYAQLEPWDESHTNGTVLEDPDEQ